MSFKLEKFTFKKPEPEAPKRSALFGTGLTKRDAERAEKADTKAEQIALNDPQKSLMVLEAQHKLEDQIREDSQILRVKVPDALELDEWQDAAVKGAAENKHICIIGAAGTGKTTTLKRVLDGIMDTIPEIEETDKTGVKHKKYAILFTAFTGRAVQQMKRALPAQYHRNCMTSHAALGYFPEKFVSDEPIDGEYKEKIRFVPLYTAYNKFGYLIIVIDEGSMMPLKLFNELVAAAPPGTRFIIMGDLNQLPPVMDRPILPFAMLKWPTFELKKIHRQAMENPIIANSQRILRGQMPVPDGEKFFIKAIDDGSVKAGVQILGSVKALAKHGKFNAMTDALIVPMNDTTLGQRYLNEDLVHFFNPPKRDNGVELNKRVTIKAARGHSILAAIGDKVMALANDNDLGITNGQIGIIMDITINGSFRDDKLGFHGAEEVSSVNLASFMQQMAENQKDDEDEEEGGEVKKDEQKDKDENQRQASHITTVKFFNGITDVEVKYQSVGQYSKLAPAYAFTCHKSQGGEYPTVVVAFHSAAKRMLTREWLYTAVTRARENIYLLCNDRAMAMALRNQSIKGSTLEEKAKSFLAQIHTKGLDMPNMPEAEKL